MRTSTIWMAFGLCGALSATGCSAAEMAKMRKEVVADVKQAAEIKNQVDAIKKGDTKAIADTSLSVAVKGALTKDEKTKGAGIEVEVKGGVVHLKGNTTAELKAHAEKVAKDVPGVGKIENEIKAPGAKGLGKDDDDDKKRAGADKADDAKDAKSDKSDKADDDKKRANSTKDAKSDKSDKADDDKKRASSKDAKSDKTAKRAKKK